MKHDMLNISQWDTYVNTSEPYPAQKANILPEKSMLRLIAAPVCTPKHMMMPYNMIDRATGITPEAVFALFWSINIHVVPVRSPHPIN